MWLAAYILIPTVTPVLDDKLLHYAILGAPFDSLKVRIFGCIAYAHKHEQQKGNKFITRTRKEPYMGSRGSPYRIFILKTKQIVIKTCWFWRGIISWIGTEVDKDEYMPENIVDNTCTYSSSHDDSGDSHFPSLGLNEPGNCHSSQPQSRQIGLDEKPQHWYWIKIHQR